MSEAEKVFNQTSKERKRIARGAVNKKNGSHSKQCKTPSDYLSKAEREKLNGEMKNYDLSKPMSWTDFKDMPPDLRSEFIRKLVDMGANRSDIADMFGITAGSYSSWMTKNHKGERFIPSYVKEPRNNDAFVEWFCNGNYTPQKKFIANVEPEKRDNVSVPAHPVNDVKKEEPRASISLEVLEGTLRYKGDARAIFEKALLLLDKSAEYEITIEFKTAV